MIESQIIVKVGTIGWFYDMSTRSRLFNIEFCLRSQQGSNSLLTSNDQQD